MKKLIMALALIASTVAIASTEVYSFTSTIKIPAIKGSAKSGYYREYVSTKMTGTLIASDDYDTEGAVINATIKKTGEEVVMTLDSDITAVILGKKDNVAASCFSAVDEDGSLQITCAGSGSTKVKVTGCGACGDSTTCTRVVKMSGNLVGLYNCGCTANQYPTIDATCDVDYEKDTDIAPVWGNWSIVLKTVDGVKYK